ncbi:ankyrin repeat-containing domain protein [Aspergillus germanicus]
MELSAETCKVLLELGAKVDARDRDGETPLHVAAGKDYDSSVAILQVLLEYGADVEAISRRYNKTPIHSAQGTANITCLHEAGAKLDHQDERGRTALHWAAHVGDMKKYECLVELGADEGICDKDGASARELYERELEEERNRKKCTCPKAWARSMCRCKRQLLHFS